jgi:hypothetical protein
MARLLIALTSLGAVVPLLAAPVPKHLFTKEPPLYYSTQKGTRWVYLEGKVEHHYEITDVEKTKANAAFLVSVAEVKGGKRTPYRTMEVSPRGLVWVETSERAAFDEPVSMLRCPVAANEKWSYQTSGPGGIGNTKGTMTVVGVEDIEVPAGKFSTVRVDQEYKLVGLDKQFRHSFWYAKDVGLVKADYGASTLVLKSFIGGKK